MIHVALHGEDSSLLWASHLSEEYHGKPILGKKVGDLVHPQSKRSIIDAFARAALLKEVQQIDSHSPPPARELYTATIYPVAFSVVRFVCVSRKIPKVVATLTKRERIVCRMLGEGMETGEIARLLKVEFTTAETHRTNARRKIKLAGNRFLAWCVEHKNLL